MFMSVLNEVEMFFTEILVDSASLHRLNNGKFLDQAEDDHEFHDIFNIYFFRGKK